MHTHCCVLPLRTILSVDSFRFFVVPIVITSSPRTPRAPCSPTSPSLLLQLVGAEQGCPRGGAAPAGRGAPPLRGLLQGVWVGMWAGAGGAGVGSACGCGAVMLAVMLAPCSAQLPKGKVGRIASAAFGKLHHCLPNPALYCAALSCTAAVCVRGRPRAGDGLQAAARCDDSLGAASPAPRPRRARAHLCRCGRGGRVQGRGRLCCTPCAHCSSLSSGSTLRPYVVPTNGHMVMLLSICCCPTAAASPSPPLQCCVLYCCCPQGLRCSAAR